MSKGGLFSWLEDISRGTWGMIIEFFSTLSKQTQCCTEQIDCCGRGCCDFSWLATNTVPPNDGFGLILEKDLHRMWRVVEIKRNSPADVDEVQLNDIVLTVNGRTMKGLSEWDIKQFFGSDEVRSVELELQSANGGPIKRVTLDRGSSKR